MVARFAKENLKAAKAAVLFDVASDYNKGIAEYFKKTFEELGGKVVGFETYTTNDKDFTSQLTKIKAAAPDVIFLPNYYNEVPLQVQQAHRLGITAPFLGSDSWGNPDLLKFAAGRAGRLLFQHALRPRHRHPDRQGVYRRVSGEIRRRPRRRGGADARRLRADLQSHRPTPARPTARAVRDAMAKIADYQGVTGEMKFQGSGDPVKSAVILQIKGRQVHLVRQRQTIMIYFLQQSLNALQLGSIYALIALGYTMVYGVLTMINFAHGDLFMLGAFFSFIGATYLKLPFVAVMLGSMLLTALIGVAIERLAYKPLRSGRRAFRSSSPRWEWGYSWKT